MSQEQEVLARYTPEDPQPDVPVIIDRITEWVAIYQPTLGGLPAFRDLKILLRDAVYRWQSDPVVLAFVQDPLSPVFHSV